MKYIRLLFKLYFKNKYSLVSYGGKRNFCSFYGSRAFLLQPSIIEFFEGQSIRMAIFLRHDLTLSEVLRYCKCDPSSKNFTDAEEMITDNKFVVVGKMLTESGINVFSLVLPKDAPTEKPHVVEGLLSDVLIPSDISPQLMCTKLQISNFTCTCEAGNNETCEHVISVLLYLYRTDMRHVQPITDRDKKKYLKERENLTERNLNRPIHEIFGRKKAENEESEEEDEEEEEEEDEEEEEE